jgi:hypothetical protein
MPKDNLGENFPPRPDSYGFEGMLEAFAPESADPAAGQSGSAPSVSGPSSLPMPKSTTGNPNAGKGSF